MTRRVAPRTVTVLLLTALLAQAEAGCTSTETKATPPESLDVDTTTGALPASAVTNWQAFFKAPPSAKERSALEKKLAAWKDDESPKALVEKGRAEVALGKQALAETSFRKALRLQPDDLEAELELAALYLRKKDVQTAFEFLSHVKDGINASDDVSQTFIFRYRYTLALGHLARDDRERGHKILSDLIGVDKGFAPAYAALASSYVALGREGVAEFVVRRGLDRAKDSPVLLNLMGVIAQKSRDADGARQWFDKALAVAPAYAPALVNRANLSLRAFEYAAAEEDLKKALSHDPLNADALVALGIVQRKQGLLTAAKASLAKAVDLAPDNAYARFNLAVLMADDLKRPAEALRLFSEVIQAPGETPHARELKASAQSYIEDLRQGGGSY